MTGQAGFEPTIWNRILCLICRMHKTGWPITFTQPLCKTHKRRL